MHVLRLINDLLRQPQAHRTPLTDLAPLLASAAHGIKGRSLVLVVSDFLCAPGWERPLSLLSRRHEVLAVRLTDPRESELPDVGPVVMQDAETGEQVYVDTHDRRFRERFAAVTRQREAALRQSFGRAGVDMLSISTGDDLVRAIVRFATLRRQRRK